VQADSSLGKIYVRNAKWIGDSYDAIFEPHQTTQIWRNGKELKPLAADRVWRARKQGTGAVFEDMTGEKR
jgi:hypothetical protein